MSVHIGSKPPTVPSDKDVWVDTSTNPFGIYVYCGSDTAWRFVSSWETGIITTEEIDDPNFFTDEELLAKGYFDGKMWLDGYNGKLKRFYYDTDDEEGLWEVVAQACSDDEGYGGGGGYGGYGGYGG